MALTPDAALSAPLTSTTELITPLLTAGPSLAEEPRVGTGHPLPSLPSISELVAASPFCAPSSAEATGDHWEPYAPFDDVVPALGWGTETGRLRFARLRRVRRAASVFSVFALVSFATMSVRGSVELTPSVVLLALTGLLAWGAAFVHTVRLHSGRMDSLLAVTRLEAVQRQIEQEGPARTTDESSRPDSEQETWFANHDVARLLTLAVDLERRLFICGARVERALAAGTIAAVTGAVSLGATLGTSLLPISGG